MAAVLYKAEAGEDSLEFGWANNVIKSLIPYGSCDLRAILGGSPEEEQDRLDRLNIAYYDFHRMVAGTQKFEGRAEAIVDAAVKIQFHLRRTTRVA